MPAVPKLSNKRLGDLYEYVIERAVNKYAKDKYDVLTRKFSSPNQRSVPDQIYMWDGGRIVFIEFKRKGRVPTKGQAREMNRYIFLGQRVFMIDNIDLGKALVDSLAREFGIKKIRGKRRT